MAADRGYITSEETSSLISSLEEVGKMLHAIMVKVESFLIGDNHCVQEDPDV